MKFNPLFLTGLLTLVGCAIAGITMYGAILFFVNICHLSLHVSAIITVVIYSIGVIFWVAPPFVKK